MLLCLFRHLSDVGRFCDDARAARLPVVYVSLGSMIVPDEIMTNAIYAGLVGGNFRVIWSVHPWSTSKLKGAVDEKQFFISAWTPQEQILSHGSCNPLLPIVVGVE